MPSSWLPHAVPGVDARHSDAIEVALWDMFAFLCALAGITATTRLPLGEIRACAATWAFFAELVAEVYAITRASGIRVAADAEARRLAFSPAVFSHRPERCRLVARGVAA